MNHLKILLAFLITFISAFALSNIATADAVEGELFGYKIGDSYEPTERTKKQSDRGGTVFVIRAENAKKPDDVGKVYLVASTTSLTIGDIYSVRSFRDKNKAEEFAYKYTAFLAAKYRKHSPQQKGLADTSRLLINFDNNYELRIRIFAPKDQKSTVHISLSIHGENKKKFSDLLKKEHDQLLIKNAEKKGIDKGL